ncbi:MAG: TrmH family RNA methyltransferase [Polaribacter sp.]|nr:TrmH family RNA methyltransferase [Polaribacter sp.]
MRKLKNTELKRLTIEGFKAAEKTGLIVVLDNIRSLNNIGSVFRTSDAFLIEKIYLCGITETPPNNEKHKTAFGATDSVDWEYAESTLSIVQSLRSLKVKVLAIEQAENSTKLNDFFPVKGEKYAVIFGNEVKGVQQKVVNESDLCIEIPQLGTKHSLNISVSAGIVLWDIFAKLNS